MRFTGLSPGYWTFYYYSVAFRSIDLDVIVMRCWDHFKLKTFQIITQPLTDFLRLVVLSLTIIEQLQDFFLFRADFLLTLSKLLYFSFFRIMQIAVLNKLRNQIFTASRFKLVSVV